MIATSTIPNKRHHLAAVEIGFSLSERAIEIEDDQTFYAASAVAIPARGSGRSLGADSTFAGSKRR
jgi:hypothetical protein